MKFLSRIIRAFKTAITEYQYDFLAETEQGWTEDDSARLHEFFNTETGRKLRIRLTNYAMRTAVVAVQNPSNNSYYCGVASGVKMAVNAIEEHLALQQETKKVSLGDLKQRSYAEEIALQ